MHQCINASASGLIYPLAGDRGVAGAEAALRLQITDPSACHLRERFHLLRQSSYRKFQCISA
jgi:hypothetical protein